MMRMRNWLSTIQKMTMGAMAPSVKVMSAATAEVMP